MDENQTKESFSDSIIKYCVDKFVDFFAKHWFKVLVLIALLAIENNRRFLGFAVGYVTGSIKVDTDDVTTLLQVIPIVLVSYLAYKTNERINKLQEQEIKDRAEKQKEEEKREKDIFFQQYKMAEIDYYYSLKPLNAAVKGVRDLLLEIENSDNENLENHLMAMEAINNMALIKIKEAKYYSESYIRMLIAGIEYKADLNQKIYFFKEIDMEIHSFIQFLESIESMVSRLKQIKKEEESLSKEGGNCSKFNINIKFAFCYGSKKDRVKNFLKKINELEKELEKS
jgi:hypothetical protein